MSPTNKTVSVSGTTIFRIENAKIAEQWVHWNLMSMMEQLGIGNAQREAATAPRAMPKAQA
jgi:hypothetical protein